MTSHEAIMIGVYDHRLVILSVLISILGSYAARDLFERVGQSRGRTRLMWVAFGAAADGIGIWSMHYTGMMALTLPVPVLYHWPTIVLSLLVGIAGSGAAVFILATTRNGWVRTVAAGICLGLVGASSLHYIAMTSMRLQAMHHYSPGFVTLSVVMAVLLCFPGLWLAFSNQKIGRLRYHGGVWLRGAAIPSLHYIAMAGITFTYSETIPNVERAVHVYTPGIVGISVLPIMLLFVITSATRKARKQRALLDELFEQAPQAVALMNVENRVIRVNREFTRLFGYTAQEANGRLISELMIPDEFKHENRKFSELVAQGKRVEAEGIRHRKDGSRLHVSIIRVPVSLPDRQIAIYGIYRDITERKQVDEQLRQSEERFRQLAESILEVFWMTDPTKQQVLYVSPGYEKLWGRTGESLYENPTGWTDAIHSEDRARVQRSATTRQVLGKYDEEFRIIRPDGSIRWVRDRAFPIKDRSGQVYRVTGIAEDITERKLAEEKLRATTEQLRALSASLQAAREEEGIRIAREIHDELGAALSSLKWDLEDLDETLSEIDGDSQLRESRMKIEAMITLTDTTVNAVRRIASELRPSILDELGLIEAIEWQARQFQDRTEFEVQCDCTPEKVNLNREQSTAVFRIFQEALTNILRHAQATRVNIQASELDGEFTLTIEDNGRGITDDEKSGQGSLGLQGMRERAHLIGGTIEIAGSEGKATEVTVRIPILGTKVPKSVTLALRDAVRNPAVGGRNEKDPPG